MIVISIILFIVALFPLGYLLLLAAAAIHARIADVLLLGMYEEFVAR